MKKTSFTMSLLVVLVAVMTVSGTALAQSWDGGSASNNDDGGDDQSAYSNSTTPSGDSGSDSDSGSEDYSGETSDNDDSTDSDSQDTEPAQNSGTSNSSGWNGGDAENNDDGSGTEEEAWSGENSSNDDDGQGTPNQWDGNESTNDDDGIGDSTQWDGDNSTNNDDGGNGGTDWNGENAENNDDGDDDDSETESGETGQEDEEEPTDSTSSSGRDSGEDGDYSFQPTSIEINRPEIDFEISPSPAKAGESVTVTGTLDYSTSRNVEVLLDGSKVTETRTSEEGDFTTTFSSDSVGMHTVTVKSQSTSAETQLDVNPTVDVQNVESSVSYSSTAQVSICADVDSQTTPDVKLVKDSETLSSKSQKGRVCFSPELSDGTHELKVVGEVEGDKDEAWTTATVSNPDSENDNIEPASQDTGFLSSLMQPLMQAFSSFFGFLAQLMPV